MSCVDLDEGLSRVIVAVQIRSAPNNVPQSSKK